jgi:5,10-methenyltetrahydrofolate synthetase
MSDAIGAGRQWASWRAAERRRLIAARLAMPPAERRRLARRIGAALDEWLADVAGLVIAAYWPIRGEPDLRPWLESVRARGAHCALPVVVAANAPLEFRSWRPGARLARGVWNIPVPADGLPVAPQLLIVPVVGFDAGGYRLGYGGGFYDRTLAAATPRPFAVGVGASMAALSSIDPQPHDVPMDAIVTEHGTTAFRRPRPTGGPTFSMGGENP